MARRRRPSYSPEFRAEAIRLVRTSTESIAKIARDLGVSGWTLRAWVNATRPPAPERSLAERCRCLREVIASRHKPKNQVAVAGLVPSCEARERRRDEKRQCSFELS